MGRIVVKNLSKAFKRYPSPFARLKEWLRPGRRYHETRWVLQNLNFTIGAGETVGIIGRNGAGKSTLLKMLTGTLAQTGGEIVLEGRVAALLELGMGFHPDFTGRQNVYMAGQLLGQSREQIDALLPSIIDFAEIGDAIDQPVRTYSSGMQVRLAFSVATAVRPDILIVDEALAVGDAHFQHKCFRRIREFKSQGVTLLFVSHDPLAVKTLCHRAILIEKGSVVMDDEPDRVLDYYNALIALDEAEAENHAAHIDQNSTTTRSGSGKAKLLNVDLLNQAASTRLVRHGETIRVRVECEVHEDIEDLTLGFLLRDRLGNEVFGTHTHAANQELPVKAGSRFNVDLILPECSLGCGSYNVTVALHSAETHLEDNYDWWDQALTFEVAQSDGPRFVGVVALPYQIELAETRRENHE
jgi:lipopolysaccharide transport system ATP-binding protein